MASSVRFPSVYGSTYEAQFCKFATAAWNRIGDWKGRVVSYAYAATSIPKEYIGRCIGNAFFYPLAADTPKVRQYLAEEGGFRRRYWQAQNPTPPFNNQKVIAHFNKPVDKSYLIALPDGKRVKLTCSIIESKPTQNPRAPFYNFVYHPGNLSTIAIMAGDISPYLEAFVDKSNEHDHPLNGRFVVITGYDIVDAQDQRYTPRTLDEAGLILKEALCLLQQDYGPIDQIAGHSLGGIIMGAAIKHFGNNLDAFPRNLLFDRAPASIWGACKNVNKGCIPLGRIIYPLAWLTGWVLNLGEEISKFYLRHQAYLVRHNITWVFSDAIQDQKFAGAQLGASASIEALSQKINTVTLGFNWAGQLFPEESHHALSSQFFYGTNVQKGDRGFIKDTDNLPGAIMDLSLLKVQRFFENKGQEVS